MVDEQVLEQGFLDDKINIEIQQMKITFKEEYKLLDDILSFGYKIISNFSNHTGPLKDLFLFATFTSIHTSYQSCIILLERGLYENEQMILRNMFENLFNFKATIQDDGVLQRLKQNYLIDSITTLNYINKHQLFGFMNKEKVDEFLTECNSRLVKDENEKGVPKLNTKQIIETYCSKEEYIVYRHLCNYTHSSIVTIDKRIEELEDGYSIDAGLRHGDFKLECQGIVCLMIDLYQSIIEYCNFDDLKPKLQTFLDIE